MPDGRKPLKNQEAVEIEYPPEILAKLKTLRPSRSGTIPREWAPWEDDLIKNHWSDYLKPDIAGMIGVSMTALKSRRYYLNNGGAE